MKYLKKYEKYKDDWKVGDIVVAVNNKYDVGTYWIIEGKKYEIIEIAHRNTTIKVKDITPNELGYYKTYNSYFHKNNFISEEEYLRRKIINKYNL